MDNVVFALGVGVGNPNLITLEAYKILKNSDIVIVPQSKKAQKSIALGIINQFVNEDSIKMFYFPTTNDDNELQRVYDEQADFIAYLYEQKKRIAYVTIGDVSIYSTFNYLSKRLQTIGIPFSIVPGVASFISFADIINKPLVVKDEGFAVVEMKRGVDYMVELFNFVNTIVILKINNRIDELLEIVNRVQLEYAYLGKRLYLEDESIVDLLKTDKSDIDNAYLSLAILKKAQ